MTTRQLPKPKVYPHYEVLMQRGRPKDYESRQLAYDLWKQGKSPNKISKSLGVSPQAVRKWIKDVFPQYQGNQGTGLIELSQDVQRDLLETKQKELNILSDLLTKVGEAIQNGDIKPKKWEDALRTFDLVFRRLGSLMPAKGISGAETQKALSDPDNEVQRNIQELLKVAELIKDVSVTKVQISTTGSKDGGNGPVINVTPTKDT
jgi:hypothetical protein